jgi:hypothetical protein
VEAFERPKYLTSLIAAVKDCAKSAQAGAFLFLLVGLYLLATVYDWFTEGFDTKDLMEAKALLAELG